MLSILGRLAARHPLRWLLAFACVLAASAWYGRDATDRLVPAPGWEVPGADSDRARELLRACFGGETALVLVLIRARGDTPRDVDAPAFRQAALQVLAPLYRMPEVHAVESYFDTGEARLRSRAGDAALALVWLARGNDEGVGAFQRLKTVLSHPALDIRLGGELATYVDMRAVMEQEVPRVERLSALLLLPALIWVFGSVVAALLPLAVGACTVLIGMALLKAAATVTEIGIYTPHVVSMLGLGLAIDYSLFILARFREELARGHPEPVVVTLRTAGRTVAFGGLMVAGSLACLALLPQRLFHDLALAGAVAVLLAMTSAVAVLPALLAWLKEDVNRLAVPVLLRRHAERETRRRWYAFSHFVMRHALVVLLLTTAALLALGAPLARLALGPADHRSLPADADSRRVMEAVEREFPHARPSPLVVVALTAGEATGEAGLAGVYALTRRIEALPGVHRVMSPVSLAPGLELEDYRLMYRHVADFPPAAAARDRLVRGDAVVLLVHYDPPASSAAARALARSIRALAAPPGVRAFHVTGFPADQSDYMQALREGLPRVVAAIVGVVYVLLFFMLGSVVLPLKAVVAGLMSLSATFGALVWIFQEGHLADLLGFTPQGQSDATVLTLIFAAAFSLAVDYEVFLLARVKEACRATRNGVEAVALGVQRSGPIITSAALLIGLVLASFATADAVFMQATALGLLISVVVDATVVRMLLVPAAMRLLGRWNWWAPRPLMVLYRAVNREEPHRLLP
ncbi:MAG: MMPL family transporter [Burkholderiales bacterium]|nr:MMPL family transporter [Burkholderiales bacterium]